MTNDKRVTQIRLTATVARKRINEAAKITAAIVLTAHAKARMAEREIVIQDLYRILRTGDVDTSPVLTDRGEWKCKITLPIRGRRVAGAVTVLLANEKLLVLTVEWEDEQ